MLHILILCFIYIQYIHNYPIPFLCKENVSFVLGVWWFILRVFLPTVEKVPAFDATKKFYQRVGSLEDVKFSSNPTGVVFWVEKFSNGFFFGLSLFFLGGVEKTGGGKGGNSVMWERVGRSYDGSINEGFCGFHSVKYHSWTWTSSETTIFYALMWFRTQAHAKVDMSRITHDRSMGLVYLPHPPMGGVVLNPKGLLNGTLSHPFGTPWRVQVHVLSRKVNHVM